LETLDKELPALQKEKENLETKMSTSLPYSELKNVTDRIATIIAELDEKEMRWLELSERTAV
jgi:ATP-binding cassette subfamily F protein uup